MKTYKFDEVIDIVKVSTCKTCATYTYTMPCTLDIDFEDYVKPITGKFQIPLKKIKTFSVDCDDLIIKSRVGRKWFEVKFKRNVEAIQHLFNIQVAGYVEDKQKIIIELQGK